MSTCPCCHKSFLDSSDPNQLCSECSRALDAGLDESSPAASPQQPPLQEGAAKKRPLIITILAIQDFLCAAAGLIVATILLSGAKTVAAVSTVLSRLGETVIAHSLPFETRLAYALLCLFCAALIYLLARGLWRLRNWARRILIVIFMLDILAGGSFDLFWPLQQLFETDPALQILGRIVTFAVICYLFTPSVKNAFGVADLSWRWLYVCTALALFSLVSALYHSKGELQALRWHRQHGNQITVQGVTFPVYRWYTPHLSETGFNISDEPGPLRPNDRMAFITVEGCPENCALTPRQLADKKFQSYKNAGYTDLKFVQRLIGGETLECVDQTMYARAIECFGNGPIGHVFFAGNESSYERLNKMLAEAR